MEELAHAAVGRLAASALTDSQFITPLSAALEVVQQPPVTLYEILGSGLEDGLDVTVLSEAVLVVLVMRLDQLAGEDLPKVAQQPHASPDGVVPAGAVAGATAGAAAEDGHQDMAEAGSSTGSATPPSLLSESTIVALLDHVRWEKLLAAEVKALFSQASSYPRNTAAKAKLQGQHLPKQAFAWLVKPDSKPEQNRRSSRNPNHYPDHISCWLDTSPNAIPDGAGLLALVGNALYSYELKLMIEKTKQRDGEYGT